MLRFVYTATIVAAVAAVSACAPHQGTGPAFRSFKDDPRGACYAERQDLERQGTRFDTSFERPARGVGDVIAAAERYLTVLVSGELGLVETLATVNADLERENTWVGWTADAFDTLTACRRANALAINNSLKAGRISRAVAEQRLATVREAYREDTARFRQFADQIALNTATFAEIYTDFALIGGAEPVEISPAPIARPARAPDAGATAKRAPKKAAKQKRRIRLARVAPQDSAAPAAKPELEKLRGALLTNTRKRDEVYQRIERARAFDDVLDLAGSLQPRARTV
ncbi:MAG: hypothetical protein AAFV19_20075 [Pseudomonadota bacterium]